MKADRVYGTGKGDLRVRGWIYSRETLPLFEVALVVMRFDDVVGIIVKLLIADIVMRATLHAETVTLQQLRKGVVVIIPAHEQYAPEFTVSNSRQPDLFPLTPI